MTKIYPLKLPLSTGPDGSTEFLSVTVKDERSNPTGTHKDRSLSRWIPAVLDMGVKKAVITSSGNSAVSAAYYTRNTPLKLTIFAGRRIDNSKLSRLKSYLHDGTTLLISDTPKRDAFRYAKENDAYFLRSSTDDLALIGYRDIAYELGKQAPDTDAVIVPTSSGTTALGIYQGFKLLNAGRPLPAIFIVQTSSVHPIAEQFDTSYLGVPEISLASSITDLIAKRRNQIVEIVNETKGYGFIISNSELLEVQSNLGLADRSYGYETLLTLAAVSRIDHKRYKSIVCLATS